VLVVVKTLTRLGECLLVWCSLLGVVWSGFWLACVRAWQDERVCVACFVAWFVDGWRVVVASWHEGTLTCTLMLLSRATGLVGRGPALVWSALPGARARDAWHALALRSLQPHQTNIQTGHTPIFGVLDIYAM
jgi:hypothetical protein